MQLEHDTKKKQRQSLTYRRTQRRTSGTARTSGPSIPAQAAIRVPQRSNATGLIFQAILGAAACLALVGVVAQSKTPQTETVPSTSPDAPPPAVFVQLD